VVFGGQERLESLVTGARTVVFSAIMPVSPISGFTGPFIRIVVPHPLPASLWRSNSLHRHYAFSVIQEMSSNVDFARLKVLDFSVTVSAQEEDSHCVYLVGSDLPAVLRAIPLLGDFYVGPELEKNVEKSACCNGRDGHCTSDWQESLSSCSSVSTASASPDFFYFDPVCLSTPALSAKQIRTALLRTRYDQVVTARSVEDRAVYKAKRAVLSQDSSRESKGESELSLPLATDGFVETKRSCKPVSRPQVPIQDLNPYDPLAEPDSETEKQESDTEIEESAKAQKRKFHDVYSDE
jgi:hypothetical protein